MINRLLGTIYLLMRKGTVTAAELAQRYEVSIRTIYRDVETLSMAGIPIYTRKGKNGGISLTEQFVLDRMLITQEEQQRILAALSGVAGTKAEDDSKIIKKLGDFFQIEPYNWVTIDFTDWSGRSQEIFEELKQAILKQQILEFDYYGQNAVMSHRRVEPLNLLFKEYTWYLHAYCHNRKSMRLFKLLRMKRVQVMEEFFVRNKDKYKENEEIQEGVVHEQEGIDHVTEPFVPMKLLIKEKEAYRVYDRFREEEITVLENGDFIVETGYMMNDWLLGIILSFGPSAKVLEPLELREEVCSKLEEMLKEYKEI